MNRVSSDRRSWRRISLWCPLDVASLWDSALRACRAAAGLHLEDWECFLLLARALRDTWENQEDPHWRRRYRILERDGWRCKAPGCTSRSGLNEHHITFRSQQGSDDAANLVTVCRRHHRLVHERGWSITGTPGHGLTFVKPNDQPLRHGPPHMREELRRRLADSWGLAAMPLTYDGPWLVGGDRMLDQTHSGWSAAPSEQPCRADLSSLLGGEDILCFLYRV